MHALCMKLYGSISMVLLFSVLPLFIDSVFAEDINAHTMVKADELYAEGKALADSFRFDDAIAMYRQALGIDKDLDRQKNIATDLNSIGEIYYEISEYDSALDYYIMALAMAKKTKNRKITGSIFLNMGHSLFELGQFDGALIYYDSALVVAKRYGDQTLEGNTFNEIGYTYWWIGKGDRTLAYYDSALIISKEIGDDKMAGNTAFYQGIYYFYYRRQYEIASAYYDSALILARQTKYRKLEGYVLVYKAELFRWASQLDSSYAYLSSAFVIAREIRNKTIEQWSFGYLAVYFWTISQYEKGFACFDSALALAKERKARNDEGVMLWNIGMLHTDFAQWHKALASFDSALAIARQTKDRPREGLILWSMGSVYNSLKKYDISLGYSDSALAILREVKERMFEAHVLDEIGCSYCGLGLYEKACAYYDSAIAIVDEIKIKYSRAVILCSIGQTYYFMAQYDKAIAMYDSALAIHKELPSKPLEVWILEAIGEAHERLNNKEEAISYYKKAIEIEESIRKELKTGELLHLYIEMQTDIYERLINLLVIFKRYDEAFEYLERSRSQELRKTIEENGVTAFDLSLSRLLETIDLAEFEMEQLKSKIHEGSMTEEVYNQEIAKRKGLLNQKYLDLKANHPQLYNLMMPQMKEYHYIQRSIPKNTVYLEFTAAEDKYVVFILTKDQFRARTYDVSKSVIDSTADQALTDLKWLKEKKVIDANFVKLYDLLIKPLEPDISPFQDIVIIPYGLLHYVPFHALRRQKEGGEYEYFVQWKKISYLPSALFITDLLESKIKAKKDLLAFANCDGSLPSAEVEVDSILKVYPKASVFKTDSATKERLIEDCCNYRLLHLATHGVLNSDPRFSHIVMSPPDQGNLTVREIVGLSGKFKNTNLVTLSACETAIEEDPQKAGMELTTLSNAFKVAGVPSIVATLWEIGDRSTAVLMKDFYANLKKKMTKLEALRQAQLAMIQDPEYGHPYYWAPFVLIGEWR